MKPSARVIVGARTAATAMLIWTILGLPLDMGLASEPEASHAGSAAGIQSQLPDLPPLAVVETRDLSGKTWQLQGTVPGALPVAARDFEVCLERQGWRLDTGIPLGKAERGSHLSLWRRGERRMILMLHEEGVVKTHFALGVEDRSSVSTVARKMPKSLPQTSQAMNQ